MTEPPSDAPGGHPPGRGSELAGDDVGVGSAEDAPAGSRAGPSTLVTGAIALGVIVLLVILIALLVD